MLVKIKGNEICKNNSINDKDNEINITSSNDEKSVTTSNNLIFMHNTETVRITDFKSSNPLHFGILNSVNIKNDDNNNNNNNNNTSLNISSTRNNNCNINSRNISNGLYRDNTIAHNNYIEYQNLQSPRSSLPVHTGVQQNSTQSSVIGTLDSRYLSRNHLIYLNTYLLISFFISFVYLFIYLFFL